MKEKEIRKVVALDAAGKQHLTTYATALKKEWWITYFVTVRAEDEEKPNNNCLPETGAVMTDIKGVNYRIVESTPHFICFECGNSGPHRIHNRFYCDFHYKKLVVTKPLKFAEKEPGRNERCYCGSGKKYKQCCMAKNEIHIGHNFNSEYLRRDLNQREFMADLNLQEE